MSKTRGLFRRMSPYNAEKARNLIDAMLMSTKEIGWDSEQQLIVNGKVYHGTDIVKLIAYVMSPADKEFKKPLGSKIFVRALKKIGLEQDYVKNKDVKRMLRTNSYSDDDENSFTDDDDENSFTDDSDNQDADESEDNDNYDESMDESAESDDENRDSMNECNVSCDEYSNQRDDYSDGGDISVENDDGNDSEEIVLNKNDNSEEVDTPDTDNEIQDNGKTRYNWKSISASDDESDASFTE